MRPSSPIESERDRDRGRHFNFERVGAEATNHAFDCPAQMELPDPSALGTDPPSTLQPYPVLFAWKAGDRIGLAAEVESLMNGVIESIPSRSP